MNEGKRWEARDMREIVSGWTDIVAISADYRLLAGLKQDGTVIIASLNDENTVIDHFGGWTDIVAVHVSFSNKKVYGLKKDGSIMEADII